ncbi:hypothetical protein CRV00_09935 [Malaciobacter molluscorum]|uniref:hypothetical protein n=1 Tax=Malaciobacter molluscorum TaxID=1032072 RepID=UPI00100BD296|nr:hypothetical protein [Malaciobacter molluscorum]RXJ93772.1 hypothetical protein CRV00_09935 [Malaciobacter molluscorum]
MKKVSFIVLLFITFLSADTIKEKMYKMNSESTCKTLFQSIMSSGDRQRFYYTGMDTENILFKEDKYLTKEVVTVLKYAKSRYFNCVSIPYANTLLLKMVFVTKKDYRDKTFVKGDILSFIKFEDFTNKLYK